MVWPKVKFKIFQQQMSLHMFKTDKENKTLRQNLIRPLLILKSQLRQKSILLGTKQLIFNTQKQRLYKTFRFLKSQIKIKRNSNFKQLRDSDNSKTVGEIRFKSNENLIIEKRQTPFIPEANLLNPDGSIVEKAKQIFTSWFKMFSTSDGLMDAENLAKFIDSCTNDNCKPDDSRVTGTISKWDHDNDGKLDLQDFLNFYQSACSDKRYVVWKNLHQHQYRNDLKKLSEIGEEVEDIDILPRNIIMNNHKFYELIIRILDIQPLSENVMNLLHRLPASPDLFKKILNLEGVKGQNNQDWSLILDRNNSYRLLYTLTIIEYLMEDNESQQPLTEQQNETKKDEIIEKEKPQTNSNNQQSEKEDVLKKFYSQGASIDPSDWREEFIQCGGFDQLFKVFIQQAQQDYTKLGLNTKNILSFILRIMKNYLTAVFANKVNHLYKINQYAVQVKYSLDVINENLKKAEESKEGEIEQSNQNDVKEIKDQQSPQNYNQLSNYTTPSMTPIHKNVFEQQTPQNNSSPIAGPYSQINFSTWAKRFQVKETPNFLILKDRLSGKLGQKILDSLDIESMLNKIIEILYNVVSIDTELESEDRVIIDFCLCIVIDIVLFDPQQRSRITKLNNNVLSSLIMKGLFNQNLNVRRVFSHSLYLISRQDKGVFSAYLLDLLMKNVPSSKDVSKSDCNQYYEILCKIIEESKEIENVSINFQNLMNDMIENIKNHESREARFNARNDKILIGFLNMCEKIIKIEPQLGNNLEQFADYLFDVCLFCKDPEGLLDQNLDFEEIQQNQVYEFNPPFYVKCKSSDSRSAAFKILTNILKQNKKANFKIVKEGLNVLIDTLYTPYSWNYRPSNEQKCHQNYLGIKNLSQICYMNSMLQQFYMTQTFRYAILAANDKEEPNLVEYRGIYIDDNVLHQIQKMFAYLDLSDRQDYNPTGFCFSFKDYMGQPVNVGVQQDAQEFLNMIFDKLETSLRQTPYKYILESIFGGKTISQMKCSQCGNIKSKHELFYTQSLTVEGCRNLQESFSKMIEGETISDFKCDACQNKCDQSRRICFSQLPNILIIQLQRIVYDLDTYANKKINTRLEFPQVLDLKEFTIEYLEQKESEPKVERKESKEIESLSKQSSQMNSSKIQENQTNIHPPEYYQYRLKGVTVHSGTAELGHYFSYINYKEDKWLEFNDSRITEFNPNNIEQNCFGGQSSNNSNNYWEKGENSQNAYILVYERELKTSLKIRTQDEEQQNEVEKSLRIKIDPQINPDKDESISQIDYYSITQRIPERQFINTWLDNHNFMLDKHVYQTEFIKFIKDIIYMVEKPKDYVPSFTTLANIFKNYEQIPEEEQKLNHITLQMCGKLFFNIFYKSCEFDILKDLLVQMKVILDLTPQYTYEFAQEFIFNRFRQIEQVLTACSEPVVRITYAQIIVFCINNLIAYYNIDLTTNQNEFIGKDESTLTKTQLVERDILNFLDKLVDIMHNEVSRNWLRMQQYLEIFRDFSYGGDAQVMWCFNKEMIARLIDFFLGNSSPLNCYTQRRHEIGNRFVSTPFGPLLQCVCYLISKVKWNMNNQKVYEFSSNDHIVLNNQEFYWKSMQENYDSSSICQIGQFMSHKNKGFSESFGRLILTGINKSNCEHIKQYLDLLSSYLAIVDEFQQNRIEWIFGYGNLKINPNDGYEMKLNLDEQIINYETNLKYENIQSVLHFLYHYRKQQENICLNILHRVLLMCKNELFIKLFIYIMQIPSPSYCCSNYFSWVRSFLDGILNQNFKSSVTTQKEEMAKSCLQIYEEVEKLIDQYPSIHTNKDQIQINQQSTQKSDPQVQNQNTQQNEQIKQDKQNSSKCQQTQVDISDNSKQFNYIIGKTVQVSENRCMSIGFEGQHDQILLREMEYQVFFTDSQPTGSTNLVFPEKVRCGTTILLSAINLDQSNINNFIYTNNSNQNINANDNNENIKNQIKFNLSENQAKNQDYVHEQQDNKGNDKGNDKGNNTKNQEMSDDIELQQKNVSLKQDVVQKQPETSVLDQQSQNQQQQSLVFISHVLNVKQQTGNLIRRFLIENKTENKVCVLITFSIEDEFIQKQTNQHMPLEAVIQVDPNSTNTLLSIRKINPDYDWSSYSISAVCELREDLKQNQQESANQQQNELTNNQTQLQQSSNSTNELKPIHLKHQNQYEEELYNTNVNIGPQLPNKSENDYSGTQQCPACTFEQPAINSICEVCESNLN